MKLKRKKYITFIVFLFFFTSRDKAKNRKLKLEIWIYANEIWYIFPKNTINLSIILKYYFFIFNKIIKIIYLFVSLILSYCINLKYIYNNKNILNYENEEKKTKASLRLIFNKYIYNKITFNFLHEKYVELTQNKNKH